MTESGKITSIYATASFATTRSPDFVVGEDDFSSLEIREGAKEGFFYFFDTKKNRLIKRFILHTSTTGIKTCCSVTFIEKNGKYTPRLELSKRKKGETLQKESVVVNEASREISSRVELSDCHENFWALIDYVQSLKLVDVPRSGWSAILNEEKELLSRVRVNQDFVQKVLTSFSTPEAQSLLIEAKKDDVKNLYASVKQAKNKKALAELERLLAGNSSEHALETWIKENDWVFGIEYLRKLEDTRIGLHQDTDLLVESLDGFVDLIELKKASAKPLFIEDTSHPGCYFPSAKLSQVIGQTIHYLSIMNDQRFPLKSEDGINVLKPRAKIVIGKSSDLNGKEKEALRKLNDTLHGIEVLTYTEISQRAKKLVDNYDK